VILLDLCAAKDALSFNVIHMIILVPPSETPRTSRKAPALPMATQQDVSLGNAGIIATI